MTPQLTYYEFFAGGGMARAGLGANWRCLFANDFDPKKGAAYSANWGGKALWVGDVAKVTTSQLPERADLVWASFPCQDLSLAGDGAGLNGARSGAFWPFWRLMEQLRQDRRKPRSIVLENVCGLLSSHNGSDFKLLCETVKAAGYWIGALVIDASLFVPQSRPRLFIVAVDEDLPIPGRVQNAWAMDCWHPERLRAAQAALPEDVRQMWLWFSPGRPPQRNLALVDLIEEEPQDVTWHSESETAALLAMMSAGNRAKIKSAASSGRLAVGAIYKRTRMEQGRKVQRAEVRFDMAGCLRTPAGGSSRQIIMLVDGKRVRSRLISARETARLMGLPDAYRLPDRYTDAYHLTGDGVAVPVVRHIAEQLLEPMLNVQVPSRMPAA